MVGVWGNSVVDARGVRSLPIFGAGSGSSPHVRKQKNARLDVRASAREPDRICLLRERRTAALNVDAERMLIGASLRASKRLRSTRPPLSAATLSWRASAGPSRGTLSLVACRCRPLARPADTLVQGLGCRPPAVPAFPRAWTWRLSCLSAHRRRQCAGATGTPDFHVANDLRTIGIPLARGLFGSSDRALSTHHRDRLIAFGVNRLFWLGAARHAEKGRSSCFNAATLVAAFDRSVVGSR